MNVLVGADPELFAMQGGKYVSAFGMVPGDKTNPYPVENGAVQVDGMALEFNINPAGTADDFVFNLQSVMAQLRSMVPDVDVVADPVARFDQEYMDAQPLEALELGCDPDFNAWTDGRVNPKPDQNLPIRTGAGHVHIGLGAGGYRLDNQYKAMCCPVIKQLDFYLGLPSLIFDEDVERRSMYGQAGAFRPKSYGMEYRVLSNRWCSDERLMRWVFSNSVLAVKTVREMPLGNMGEDVERVINTSDVQAARELIAKYNIPMPEGF